MRWTTQGGAFSGCCPTAQPSFAERSRPPEFRCRPGSDQPQRPGAEDARTSFRASICGLVFDRFCRHTDVRLGAKSVESVAGPSLTPNPRWCRTLWTAERRTASSMYFVRRHLRLDPSSDARLQIVERAWALPAGQPSGRSCESIQRDRGQSGGDGAVEMIELEAWWDGPRRGKPSAPG